MEFLDRLIRHQAGKKVFLIVDRHAVYKATKVTKWLGGNEDKIRFFFIPPYRPELNSDELLNQELKNKDFWEDRARDKQDMMSKTRAFLRSKQRRPQKSQTVF